MPLEKRVDRQAANTHSKVQPSPHGNDTPPFHRNYETRHERTAARDSIQPPSRITTPHHRTTRTPNTVPHYLTPDHRHAAAKHAAFMSHYPSTPGVKRSSNHRRSSSWTLRHHANLTRARGNHPTLHTAD